MKKLITFSATALTVALLVAGGSAIASAAEPDDNTDVGVDVTIEPLTTPGSLTMTVAPGRVTLTENGSTDTVRQFTGTLPQVTVTDTRTAEQLDGSDGWYVLGSATDFTSTTGTTIGADQFGWSPTLISGDDSVSLGGDVDTSLDPGPANRGLVDQELLYLGDPDTVPAGGTTSTATADLTLKTEPTVTPGAYTSTITLSLFE